MRLVTRSFNAFSKIPQWATLDPWLLSAKNPHTVCNILDGKILTSNIT